MTLILPEQQVSPMPSDTLKAAQTTLDKAVDALKEGDVGAHWQPEVVEAARLILTQDKAHFARIRANLKAANKEAQVTEWTKEVKQSGGEDQAASRADELVDLVQSTAELFHDPKGNGCATFDQKGHRETWALGSKGFYEWLEYRGYNDLGFVPSEHALKGAIGTLKGLAKHEGEERPVYLRTAPAENGGYWVDLTNDDWSAVKVTSHGWQIIRDHGVKFIRSATAAPFPKPVTGGDINRLWEFVNVPRDARLLTLAFILEAMRPETPYTVLELCGGQGTGKSTSHKRVRSMVDPNTVPLRAAPKDRQDIFVAAGANYLVSFENLSHLSSKAQDAMCTLATGGGYASRKLYTDDDESVIEVKRPIVLNAIVPVATRPDLIDRAIHIDLPPLAGYRPESAINAEWEAAYPALFGALLDLFAATLAALPTTTVDNPPRMADFAVLGQAMCNALNNGVDFAELYRANRAESLHRSLDSSPAALAVVEFMRDGHQWTGTMKMLKARLEERHRQDGEGWPSSAKGLGDILRRTAPALKELGIGIEFDSKRHRDGYHLTLFSFPTFFSNPESCSQPSQRSHQTATREHGEHGEGHFGIEAKAEKEKGADSHIHGDNVEELTI